MSVIITGYVDALRSESPSVIIKNNGFTRIALPLYRIRVYARYYSVYVPVTRRIDVSLDGSTYTTSARIDARELDDPIYDLLFTFTGRYTDIWVRPTYTDPDVMLGDTISQIPYEDPYNDYPYNRSTPYQYSVHNGVAISGDVDLYFQISSAP